MTHVRFCPILLSQVDFPLGSSSLGGRAFHNAHPRHQGLGNAIEASLKAMQRLVDRVKRQGEGPGEGLGEGVEVDGPGDAPEPEPEVGVAAVRVQRVVPVRQLDEACAACLDRYLLTSHPNDVPARYRGQKEKEEHYRTNHPEVMVLKAKSKGKEKGKGKGKRKRDA